MTFVLVANSLTEESNSFGSGKETGGENNETTPTSPTTTDLTTDWTTTSPATEAKFSTSEIIIISAFSVFGFIFFISTLVAICSHKIGLTMIGLTLLIATGMFLNSNT